MLGRWDVAPDWFTPKNTFIATSHEEPPPPRVAAIQVDRRGRVWTLVYRPDEDWRRGVAPPRQAPSAFELLAHEDYVDTQIEVFDSQTFERIASLRVDDPLGEFVAAGIAMTAEVTDSEGYPLVRFWRVSLPERR